MIFSLSRLTKTLIVKYIISPAISLNKFSPCLCQVSHNVKDSEMFKTGLENRTWLNPPNFCKGVQKLSYFNYQMNNACNNYARAVGQ